MLTKIYCEIDDFYKIFEKYWSKTLIADKKYNVVNKSKLSPSEIMTIVVYFHLSNYRTFKHYYIDYVCVYLKNAFPDLVSYNRFLELMQSILIPLIVFLKTEKLGKPTGISFIDSTSIKVCNNKRIHNHKVFKGLAERGKNSMGWFYGFKLHLIINDRGEIISFSLTAGNVDDRNLNVIKKLTKTLFGKLFGDKGYISSVLFKFLLEEDITLITRLKKNMKNKLINVIDKVLLRKRSLIETVNDELKNVSQIEHTRHRSGKNFLVNLISGLVSYCYKSKKPSLNLDYDFGTKELLIA